MNFPNFSTYLLVALASLTLTFTWSCSRGGDSGSSGGTGFGGPGGFVRTTTVESRPVQQAEISDQIRAFGSVRAQDNVRITPQVNMDIIAIRADLGDTVRAGQTLALLRDEPFAETVRRDELQLEQAMSAMQRDSVNFTRQQELFRLSLVSQAELDAAQTTFLTSRANLQSARATLSQSRQNLSYTRITSPVNGVVTRRLASPGDVVGPGQTVFEISNLAGYEITLNLPLRSWAQVQIGQPVDIRLSGAEIFNSRGTITRISPELDPVTGLGEVVVSVINRGQGMFPGVLVENRINVEIKTDAVVIPRSAMVENVSTVIDPESNTIRLSRTFAAFVAQGDTIAVRRDLELGIQQGDRIEVVSGLNPGESLIITGQTALEDGSRIRISGAPRFGPGGRPQGIEQSENGQPTTVQNTQIEQPQTSPAAADTVSARRGDGSGMGQGTRRTN
ncbi:MAG: efflux RND transporter periplasmic adaptor subunit [Bacteroidetes bacterium]|nr:efflux RND transporter periplasmic adaptor subunit [Bacteroidota bacterium]